MAAANFMNTNCKRWQLSASVQSKYKKYMKTQIIMIEICKFYISWSQKYLMKSFCKLPEILHWTASCIQKLILLQVSRECASISLHFIKVLSAHGGILLWIELAICWLSINHYKKSEYNLCPLHIHIKHWDRLWKDCSLNCNSSFYTKLIGK